MITQFKQPNDLYPPFYSLLAFILGGVGKWLEFGGKIVSIFSSALLIFPLFLLAKKITNPKTALYTCIIYTVSPSPLRWGIRVMSDALFSLIFLSSVYFILIYYQSFFKHTDDDEKSLKENENNLTIGIILAVLSTLTHYRGIILFPLSLFPFLFLLIKEKKIYPKIFFANLIWCAVPVWMMLRGFQHFTQIEERMGISAVATVLNYLNNFESFVLLLPYFLTYPIAIFTLYGLFKGKIFSHDKIVFSLVSFYLIVCLIGLQSVFSSFQSRYLLPIFPLLFVYGGIGIAEFEGFCTNIKLGRKIFKTIVIITIVWGFVFSILVCYLQKGVFGDIKQAGLFLSKQSFSKDKLIFSNETYKPTITGTKLAFWSGKDIHTINNYRTLPSDSILVIHSVYGGMTAYLELLKYLPMIYEIKPLAKFNTWIIPLFPDVMEEPTTHQNPMAWVFRYIPQNFETTVFEIKSKRNTMQNFLP